MDEPNGISSQFFFFFHLFNSRWQENPASTVDSRKRRNRINLCYNTVENAHTKSLALSKQMIPVCLLFKYLTVWEQHALQKKSKLQTPPELQDGPKFCFGLREEQKSINYFTEKCIKIYLTNNLLWNCNFHGKLRSWGRAIQKVWNSNAQKDRGLCVWFGTLELCSEEARNQTVFSASKNGITHLNGTFKNDCIPGNFGNWDSIFFMVWSIRLHFTCLPEGHSRMCPVINPSWWGLPEEAG